MGLGLNMKKIIAITALAILLPLVLFGFIGCMKKPDHSPNYGPEVSWEQIQKVWNLDTPPEPLSMKPGQYVSLNYTQVIDVQSPLAFRQRSDEVKSRTEDPEQIEWIFHTKENILDFESGQWKSSEQDQEPLYYLKNEAQPASLSLKATGVKPQSHIKVFSLQALKAVDQTTPQKITYHNLHREDGFLPVPQIVRNKPNCGGVLNCEQGLRFMRISFDRVVWESAEKGIKTTYRITYSPDMPTYIYDWTHPNDKFPTNQYQFCAQTWLNVTSGSQNQIVPVMECAEVVDFQFGS